MVQRVKKATRTSAAIYEFSVSADAGSTVALAGSFNDWDPDSAPMQSGADGRFSCRIKLEPGVFEYKFVINDVWLLDKDNANFASNDFGTLNSVLTVE